MTKLNKKVELSYNDICWIVQALKKESQYYNNTYIEEVYSKYRNEIQKLSISMSNLKREIDNRKDILQRLKVE